MARCRAAAPPAGGTSAPRRAAGWRSPQLAHASPATRAKPPRERRGHRPTAVRVCRLGRRHGVGAIRLDQCAARRGQAGPCAHRPAAARGTRRPGLRDDAPLAARGAPAHDSRGAGPTAVRCSVTAQRVSASSLDAVMACLGYAVLPAEPRPTSEAAARGTAIHAYLEAVSGGQDPAVALEQVPDAWLATCRSIRTADVPSGWPELAYAYDP